MDALERKPEITKQFLVQTLKGAFPGAKLRAINRIGGVVVSINVWQFTIEASLTTSQVSHADEIGAVSFLLSQTSTVPGKEKWGAKTQVLRAKTKSPDTVRAFVDRTRAFLQGAAAAILSACDKPEESQPEGPFGDFEDQEEVDERDS